MQSSIVSKTHPRCRSADFESSLSLIGPPKSRQSDICLILNRIFAVVALMTAASIAQAQGCVYKSVMTDEEIAACKNEKYDPLPRELCWGQTEGQQTPECKASLAKFQKERAALQAQTEANRAKQRVEDEKFRLQQQQLQGEIQDVSRQQTGPRIGMTAAEADEGFTSGIWQYHHVIRKTTTANHVTEQWVYSAGSTRAYLYFRDGVLTSIQE